MDNKCEKIALINKKWYSVEKETDPETGKLEVTYISPTIIYMGTDFKDQFWLDLGPTA